MGDLSYWEHYETFGGEPQPGEAHPSAEAIDNARKAERENLDGEREQGLGSPAPRPGHVLGHREARRESTSPGGVASYSSGRGLCAVCGAGPDDDCAPGCETNR